MRHLTRFSSFFLLPSSFLFAGFPLARMADDQEIGAQGPTAL